MHAQPLSLLPNLHPPEGNIADVWLNQKKEAIVLLQADTAAAANVAEVEREQAATKIMVRACPLAAPAQHTLAHTFVLGDAFRLRFKLALCVHTVNTSPLIKLTSLDLIEVRCLSLFSCLCWKYTCEYFFILLYNLSDLLLKFIRSMHLYLQILVY